MAVSIFYYFSPLLSPDGWKKENQGFFPCQTWGELVKPWAFQVVETCRFCWMSTAWLEIWASNRMHANGAEAAASDRGTFPVLWGSLCGTLGNQSAELEDQKQQQRAPWHHLGSGCPFRIATCKCRLKLEKCVCVYIIYNIYDYILDYYRLLVVIYDSCVPHLHFLDFRWIAWQLWYNPCITLL